MNDFKWNIPEKYKDRTMSHNLLRVRMILDSAYKWGRGWSAEEKKEFSDVVFSALRDEGYVIVDSMDAMSAPYLYLDKRVPKGLEGNDTKRPNLYLHPMEFSGYLPKEDVDKITKILKEKCGSVCRVDCIETKEVSSLQDFEYKALITQHNSKGIVNWIKNHPDRDYFIKHPSEAGFEFARHYRIERAFDGAGLCGMDTDIETVSSVIDVAKSLGCFEKELEKEGPELD